MPKEIRLPQLGQTMEEGTVVACTVKVGDYVKKGDVIFEIETDKATIEMESPDEGFVKHILAEPDQTLLVGDVMMVLGEENEDVPDSFIQSLKAVQPQTTEATPSVTADRPEEPQAPAAAPQGKAKASPRAKKLAAELGVDLATITGTGPAGRITEKDVTQAAKSKTEAAAQQPRLGATIPLSRIQKITAEKMAKSGREIPSFSLTAKVDVTELVEYRDRLNQTADIKISYNDFILRAVAIAMEQFPVMTGTWRDNEIRLADSINIGLAVSVGDDLVAPVVKDVNTKDLPQIARCSRDLIAKAQDNKLQPADLEGASITVSNLGSFYVHSFTPIVIPGQCAILGIGRITDTVVPADKGSATRKIMTITLCADHRIVNGAYAARFLNRIKEILEDVSTLA